jgi:hypothetical protein
MATLNSNAHGSVPGVQDILPDTDLGTGAINRYINMAYYRTKDIDLSNCGGTAAMGEVQNLLAAHFISIGPERQTESESIGGEASVKFTGKTSEGLRATLYGQAAIDMDCTGALAKAGMKRASFRVWSHDDIDYDYESEDYD